MAHKRPNFPVLKATIYPLLEVTTDNFFSGYKNDEAPLDEDSNYRATDDGILEDMLNKGLRPFDSFTSEIPLSVLDQVQEAIVSLGKESTPISVEVEPIIRTEYNLSYIPKRDYIGELNFDCQSGAAHSSLDNVVVHGYSESFGVAKMKTLKYASLFMYLRDKTNDDYVELVFDDGTNQRIYKISTFMRKSWKEYSLSGQVLSTKTVWEATTTDLAETKLMRSLLTTVVGIVVKTDFSDPKAVVSELKDAIEMSTQNFSFSIYGVDYNTLVALRRASGNTLYGVCIKKDGEAFTQTVNKDNGTYAVLKTSDAWAYGYVDVRSMDMKTGKVNFSGYYTKLSRTPTAMNFLKFDSVLTNSELNTGSIGSTCPNWTVVGANSFFPYSTASFGGLSRAVFDANGTTITADINASFTKFNSGNRVYVEVGVQRFQDTQGANDVALEVSDSGGAFDTLTIPIVGDGKIALLTDVLTGDVTLGGSPTLTVRFIITNHTGTDRIFYVEYVRVGECVEAP